MTELREALKPKADEDPLEFAERVTGVLERHHQQTGENVSAWAVLPGEGPGECLERTRKLNEADRIRWAEQDRRREGGRQTNAGGKEGSSVSLLSSSYRIKSQERDVERAILGFEEGKKKLHRKDGTRRYSEQEHAERLERLTGELRERVGSIAKEAEKDAQGYEEDARALSYSDPTAALTEAERSRLESARPFAKEDCERLSVEDLLERLESVATGDDKVAKILHARYGRFRLEALQEEADRVARDRLADPRAAERARHIHQLTEALSALEQDLQDRPRAERAQKLMEAAERSRQVVRDTLRRLQEADGTDEAARASSAKRIQEAL